MIFFFGCVDFFYMILYTTMILVDLYDFLITQNRFLFCRLRGMSCLYLYDILFLSISGVLLRSVGVVWDVRLFCCYDVYFFFLLDFMFCLCGDAYDRFLMRLFDMRMSFYMCKQLLFFNFMNMFYFFVTLLLWEITIDMIIHLFCSLWCCLNPGITMCCIEHPKGDYLLLICLLYFFLNRLRLRSSDFLQIFLLDFLIRGFLLHDLCAVLGNIDIVFGSIDR